MQRKRRKKPRRAWREFVYLAIGGWAAWVLLRPSLGAVSVVLLWLSVFTLWLLLFMPTRCGYKVRDLDRGCLLRVDGLARGCYKYHSQVKRDAIFEAFGLRNPALRFRKVWQSHQAGSGSHVSGWSPPAPAPSPPPSGSGQPKSAAARKQAMYNASMWVFSLVSAVAGVVMPFLAP
jgi:hypothetical protein